MALPEVALKGAASSPRLRKCRSQAAVRFGSDVVSVILTGMGQDGAVGMKEIKQAGGYIIAEHESTCVVYGMPKAVVDQGIADEVLPLTEIASAIVRAVKH